MNERIRELVGQAVIAVDDPFPGNPLNDELEKMYIPDCFAEKFAELIVRECAQVSERTGALNEADFEGEMIADAIKEHFGIK